MKKKLQGFWCCKNHVVIDDVILIIGKYFNKILRGFARKNEIFLTTKFPCFDFSLRLTASATASEIPRLNLSVAIRCSVNAKFSMRFPINNTNYIIISEQEVIVKA